MNIPEMIEEAQRKIDEIQEEFFSKDDLLETLLKIAKGITGTTDKDIATERYYAARELCNRMYLDGQIDEIPYNVCMDLIESKWQLFSFKYIYEEPIIRELYK